MCPRVSLALDLEATTMKPAWTIWAVMLVAAARADRVNAQQLNDSCTVTVNGQTVQVNSDGTFVIPNVAAADLFGPGGPGTVPDFLSDDFLRVVGTCTSGGQPVYVTSECFRIRRGQSFQVGELTFSTVPPQGLAAVRAAPGEPTLTTVGQQTPINLTGFYIDGSSGPLDPNLHCPATFRTSNPRVVTVAPDLNNPQTGVATARGAGTALITASVEGATSVTSITVSLGDPLTTVTGIVQTTDGDLVDGAVVRFLVNGVVISGTAVTGGPGQAPGQFTATGVASQLGPISAYAEATVSAVLRSGVSLSKIPVPGGFTDAGLITLDDRVFWITNASGLWQSGANWSGGAPPRPTQTALIDVPADITVTHSLLGTSSIASLRSEENFSLVQGTLSLAEASFVNGRFSQSNSSLGGAGTLAVNDLYTWTSGTMGIGATGGGTTLLNSGMTLAGTLTKQLIGRTLTNANNGVIRWTAGVLFFSQGSVFNNETGSTFDIQTDAGTGASGTISTFNNAGTVRKSAGSGVAILSGINFNNSGTVAVETGTLRVGGGSSSGSFTVSPGATMEFSPFNNLPHAITGQVTIPVGATLRFAGFTTNVNGPTAIAGAIVATEGAVANFNAVASAGVSASSISLNGVVAPTVTFAAPVTTAAVTQSSGVLGGAGTLTVSGPYNWTGGTMGVGANGGGTTLLNGGMTLAGTLTKQLTARTLTNTNNGVIRWTAGVLSFSQGSVLDNQTGSTFDIQTDAGTGASGTISTFNNAGTVRKSAGSGVAILSGVNFNNSGTVAVETGSLRIGNGSSSGSFVVSPGATIDVSPSGGAGHTITGDVTIPLGATLRFAGFGSTTNVNGPTTVAGAIVATGGATVNFNAGASAGVLASSILLSDLNPPAGTNLNAAGAVTTTAFTQSAGTLGGPGTLTVNGPYTWTGGTMGVAASGGTTLLNGGMTLAGTLTKQLTARTLTNTNNGVIRWTAGVLSFSQGSVLNNETGATFDIQTDADTIGSGAVSTFNNSGTLRKSAGSATTSLAGANFINSGVVEVMTGTLDFPNVTYTQSSGDTILLGGAVSKTGSVIQINGGTIGLGAATSSGTITGSVTCGGSPGGTVTPRPGAAGTLTISGTYTQNAGGTLDIELGGTSPGSSYDQLVVGTAALGGTLQLTLINAFTPTVGQQFTILTAGSLSGTFSTVTLTNFPANRGVNVSYNSPTGTVTVMITGP